MKTDLRRERGGELRGELRERLREAGAGVRVGASLSLIGVIVMGSWLACRPPPTRPIQTDFVDPGAENIQPVEHAVSVVHPVGDGEARGVVTFESISAEPGMERGLRMRARFTGLPEGLHAFHVHLLGDCRGESGKRAGTHFNFAGPSRQPPSDIDRITGDLGELDANAEGEATLEAEIERARLQGPFSILGRSIIVHARGNDPEQPPIGAAGARLACGVIGLTEG